MEWEKEGSPTLFLETGSCTFGSVQSSELKSCLSAVAKTAPSTILVKANPNVHYDVVSDTISSLKAQGVRNIMFGTKP